MQLQLRAVTPTRGTLFLCNYSRRIELRGAHTAWLACVWHPAFLKWLLLLGAAVFFACSSAALLALPALLLPCLSLLAVLPIIPPLSGALVFARAGASLYFLRSAPPLSPLLFWLAFVASFFTAPPAPPSPARRHKTSRGLGVGYFST